jgi:pimeloyl-ACP methyl ester carboxylesterase
VTGEDQYKLNGVALPLAADYTAPLAALVEKTGMTGWDGLFDAIEGNEDLLKNTGFYTTEPYNAGKTPLITVHGLFSNPLTWLDVHNDLMGDPVIREHFQVWHYLYPTSLPIVENAKTFREKLDQLHDYLVATSPKGTTPQNMVIVAHSMGGLLTRTVVVHDSRGLQELFFEDPTRVKELDKEVQAQIDAYLNFSRKPYVDRVIFVAVPHRGSDIADNWIGRIGRALLSLPKTVVQKTVAVARSARNIIRPDLQTEFDKGEPSSIQGLSAKNPTLIALSKLEIDSHVQYHSIIGDRGLGDTPQSSDGVVTYSSSHVDGAASELIVPADHTAHAHPKAVGEIRRILREHMDQLLQATAASKKR